MIQIANYRVTSTEGHLVARRGDPDSEAHGMIACVSDANPDDYREVTVSDRDKAVSDADALRRYEAEVERRIAQRYTHGQEMATLRQRDTKPDEFAEYNAYAEQCKADARAALGCAE